MPFDKKKERKKTKENKTNKQSNQPTNKQIQPSWNCSVSEAWITSLSWFLFPPMSTYQHYALNRPFQINLFVGYNTTVKAVVHVATNSLRRYLRQLRQHSRIAIDEYDWSPTIFKCWCNNLEWWRNDFVSTSEKAFISGLPRVEAKRFWTEDNWSDDLVKSTKPEYFVILGMSRKNTPFALYLKT